MDGRELFRRMGEVSPGSRTVLMTAFGSIKDAIAALQEGAEGYLEKPFETDELVAVVTKAAEKARLSAENRVLREQLAHGGAYAGLIGQSRVFRKLLRVVDRIAGRDGTVLITGESGTGKELVARAIHQMSARRSGPFVGVHCGALPEGLVETELFGVVEGAFTGAERSRTGYAERATGGILFLDEIGELPLQIQPSLLRFLESGEVVRVGGSEVLHPDVRVLTATNRDLRAMVEDGTFRADLFYRLNVLPVSVPPLRERVEDIPLLMARFLDDVGRPALVLGPDVIACLQGLPWPGNVRELRNLGERLASTIEEDVVEFSHLPAELRGDDLTPTESFRPYRMAMESFEREYLLGLLGQTRGNVSEAARLAGMPRPSLHARLSALKIEASEFRGR
jgi:two-component system response regulator HydG